MVKLFCEECEHKVLAQPECYLPRFEGHPFAFCSVCGNILKLETAIEQESPDDWVEGADYWVLCKDVRKYLPFKLVQVGVGHSMVFEDPLGNKHVFIRTVSCTAALGALSMEKVLGQKVLVHDYQRTDLPIVDLT